MMEQEQFAPSSLAGSSARSSRCSQDSLQTNCRSCDDPSQLRINPFAFPAKTAFDASKALTLSRNDAFKVRQPTKDDDIWKRPPPDFRPQVYNPRPPKRNSREAMQPWKYGTMPGEGKTARRQVERVFLPHIWANKEKGEAEFITAFHVMDPDEARMQSVKDSHIDPGPFQMPKLHDFREMPTIKSLGLPEFEVGVDPDPFNIKFHTARLRIIHGRGGKGPTERSTEGQQMAPPLHQPPKWEDRLILPKTKWPNMYQAYTRYKPPNCPRRAPDTALMDRIEESLTNEWTKEQTVRASTTLPTSTQAS